MNVDQARQALAIFSDICGLEPDQRRAALDTRCGDDADLRAAVERMLAADTRTAALIQTQVIDDALAGWVAEAADPVEEMLHHPGFANREAVGGQYRILRVLGEGGMGTVYEAEQVRPRRRVAIKAIRPGRVSRSMLRRFEYEAHLLARLQHPGIAQVFEADVQIVDRQVQAYIAMELVAGRRIDDFALSRRLSVDERVRLFIQVCDAVQHAHQVGIIHRDLKPANILITDSGQPKVLDFGVARAVEEDDSAPTLTHQNHIVGTLAYMSPEQVMSRADLDVRADVYSLGVILYRLLTGVMPIDVTSCTLPEAARRICEVEAPGVRTQNALIHRDLDSIVTRALDKDRNRRYRSADDFARDLQRYLDGEAVDARRGSRLYFIRKSLWRHRILATFTATAALALAAFAFYAAWQARESRKLAVAAERARSEASEAQAQAQADALRLRDALYYSRIGYAQAAMRDFDSRRVRNLLKESPAALRDWEWGYLNFGADESERFARFSWDRLRSGVACHHMGISGSPAGEVALHEMWTNDSRVISTLTDSAIVTLSQDESLAAGGGPLGVMHVYDVRTRQELWNLDELAGGDHRARMALRWLVFTADTSRLLSGGDDGRIRIWNARSGELERTIETGGAMLLEGIFLNRSERIVTGDFDGRVAIWSSLTGERIRDVFRMRSPTRTLAVSPDESALAASDVEGNLTILNLETSEPVGPPPTLRSRATAMRFSPDGRTLAIGGLDGAVRLIDFPTRGIRREYVGHGDYVLSIEYSADGKQLTSTSVDGTVRVWSNEPMPTAVLEYQTVGQALGLSIDSQRNDALVVTSRGGVKRISLETTQVSDAAQRVASSSLNRICISPDGRLIATSGDGAGVRIWDGATEALIRELPISRTPAPALSFSRDVGMLAAGDSSGRVRTWTGPSFEMQAEFTAGDAAIMSLDFDNAGRLATGSADGAIQIWNPRTGEREMSLRESGRLVYRVVFSPDGAMLVNAGEDSYVQIWDAKSGQPRFRCIGHTGPVLGAAFHPGGKRLITGGVDRVLRLWNMDSGQEVLALRGHDRIVQSVAFTSDGRTLVSTSDDGTVRIWRSTALDAPVGMGHSWTPDQR